jgi:hypothetical protein
MGWKNVKDHYHIDYIVHVTNKGICVGMGYLEDIITIHGDGELSVRKHYMGDGDFSRYEREMRADPETLRRLIETPDQFEKSITVYTFKGDQILEKQAEACGFPHVTHDGVLMSDNEFSTDKKTVITWAKSSAASSVVGRKGLIEHFEKELQTAREGLIDAQNKLTSLNAQYPSARSTPDSSPDEVRP